MVSATVALLLIVSSLIKPSVILSLCRLYDAAHWATRGENSPLALSGPYDLCHTIIVPAALSASSSHPALSNWLSLLHSAVTYTFFSKLLPTVQCCCCNKSATMTPSPGTTICFVEQMLPGLEGRKNDTTWTRQSRINSTALLLVMWGPSVRTFPYRIRANCIVQRYRTRQNRRPLSKPRFLSVSPPAHIKPNLHLNHVK